METLGEIVKRKRIEMGLSQKDFGRLIGMGQTAITPLEKGETALPRDPDRLAAVLEITRNELDTLMARAAIVNGTTDRLPPGVRVKVAEITGTMFPFSHTSNTIHAAIAARGAPPMGKRDVPVYGRAHGGSDGMFEFNGEVVGWAERLPELEGVRDAYAVYVDGESMFPRYKVGETVWVNPTRPPARGDDVIVQLHPLADGDAPFGFIKEFRSRTPTHLVVWQHNPQGEIKYPIESVKSVHYIAYSQR